MKVEEKAAYLDTNLARLKIILIKESVREILIGGPRPSWFAVVVSQQRGGTGLGGHAGSRLYGSLINNAETFCLLFSYLNHLVLQQK